MSAVADSIAPLLEQKQRELLLAGDVQLSQTVGRMLKTWRRARVETAKREAEESANAAKAVAVDSTVALTVLLPFRTISEINTHEHWSKIRKKVGYQRGAAKMAMQANANRGGHKIKPPCRVLMTRLAPDELDVDNLRSATKHVQDGIADWLGINDRSPAVTWECKQEKAQSYGVRVEVFS